MLNRVRDFRYEEIKNWKPLVSLRESYRKESGVRNLILVATCVVAILVGYSVINGSLRFTGAARQQTAQEPAKILPLAASTGASVAQPRAALDGQAESARVRTTELPQGTESMGGIAPIPTIDQRGRHMATSFQETRSATPTAQERGAVATGSVRGPRIAVCDVQRILANELANYAANLTLTSENELRAEQASIYDRASQFDDVQILILQKLFEQKKELAILQIRERVAQYRELAERELRSLADQIATEYNFDVVLTADQVLSFTPANDITRLVRQVWDERRQNQVQTDRQSTFPRR
jgi:Skp family chaperone for outer membrane proteins